MTAFKLAGALLLGVAFIMVGNGLQTSLLGLRANLEGFATTSTGIIMSAFYVGFVAGSLMTPKTVRAVGHIRVFAAWAAVASAAVLLHSLVVYPAAWALFRFLTGFCYAGLYVVVESWLNDRADNRSRGRLLSVYMIVQYAGLAVGQGLLNTSELGGHDLFILASILISLAVVPIALSTSPVPAAEAQASMSPRALFRLAPVGVIGCATCGMATGMLLGMGAVYGEAVGLSVRGVSAFMAAIIVGGVMWQFPLGRLSDRFDRRRVIIAVSAAAALVAGVGAAMNAAPGLLGAGLSTPVLLGAAFLVGGLALPIYALALASTNDALSPRQMVAASSSLVLIFGLSACLGPLGSSLAMSWMGPAGFFVGLAALHGLAALLAVANMWLQARGTGSAGPPAYLGRPGVPRPL